MKDCFDIIKDHTEFAELFAEARGDNAKMREVASKALENLHGDLNKLKATLGKPVQPYKPVDRTVDIESKKAEYQNKIDELNKAQTVVIDEPNKPGEGKGKDVVVEEGVVDNGLSEGANKILGLHDNGVNFDLFDNNKLREIAKENGIDLPEGAKNADIIEALKNKRNELANKKNETQDVNESIGTEDNTETILATAEKKGGIYAQLAKAVKNLLGGVKTTVYKNLSDFAKHIEEEVSTHGAYDESNKTIHINNATDKNKLHIFFHEALHHITIAKIKEFEKNPNSKNLTPSEFEAILNLKRIYKQISEKVNRDRGGFGKQSIENSPTNLWMLGDRGTDRGFANVHEFISEAFTNPEFQKILSQFKGEGKEPNLFKQFVNAVAKMLGLKDPTILDDIFHHTEKLIDKEQSLSTPKSKSVDEGVVDKPELKSAIDKVEAERKEAQEAQNFQHIVKVETYEGVDDNGNREVFDIITTKDGKKRVEKDGHILGKGFNAEVPNEKLLEFTDNPKLIRSESSQEHYDRINKERAEQGKPPIKTVAEKIDAKYDAEISKLKEQSLSTKPEIKNEKQATEIPNKKEGDSTTESETDKATLETEAGEGNGKEPPKGEDPVGEGAYVENPEISFRKGEFVRARNKIGIDEFVDEGTTTHIAESTKAQRTIEKWKEDGTYAENMADIQERAAKGQISNQEKFIFAKHIADLDTTVNSIKDINSAEYDKALGEYNKALDAADKARSEAGRLLGMVPKNRGTAQTLADVMVDMMGDKGVDVLTPEQKIVAEKRYNDVKLALDKEAALRIEAENKVAELEAENAILKAKKENAKNSTTKKNKTAEDYTKEREDIKKNISEKLRKSRSQANNVVTAIVDFTKIAPDVAKLIGSYVEQNSKILLKEVRDLLKKDLEGIGEKVSDEEIRGLIAGHYNEKKQTKNELSAQVYDLRREEKLLLELDALESGKEPTTEKGRQVRNQRLKDIRDKIEVIKKQNGIGKYSDENRFISTAKQRIAANKKIQAELQDRINKGDYAEKPQNQSILENTQFKEKYPRLYKEYEQSIIDKDKKAFEYEQKRINDKIKNYGWVEKFGHGVSIALHTSKGTVAIFDQSGLLVQLIQTTGSHPWETAKNVLPAIRDLFTNKWFDANMAKLKTSKYWDLLEKMGLPLYDTHSHDINFRNDLLGGDKNLMNRDITVKGKKFSIGKAFERSTATLFNNIRVKLAIDKIDQLYLEGKTWENAPEEFKAVARVISEFTGHGKVAKSFTNENWNLIIWSSKMMASTFNTLGLGDAIRPLPAARTISNDLAGTKLGKAFGLKEKAIDPKRSKGFYSSLTPQQRKFAAKEMSRFILSGATVMAAAYAKGKFLDDDDEKTTVDVNPLSTEFGTIKSGNKTVNVYGRYSSTVAAIAQITMGIRYLGGDKKDVLGDRFGDKSAGDVAFGKFGRGKMTPIAGLLYDVMFNNKKNYFTKEEITTTSALKQVAVPLAWQDLAKDIQREDPALSTALWTIFKIYGGNVKDERDYNKKQSIRPAGY